MKCRWYADFEGVCTNGECPYRGDACPTSEHPEVCKYSETKYEVSELVKILRCCSNIGYVCEECPANLDGEDCDGRLAKLQAADMLEKLAAEKDEKKPKNHVLTLEELEVYTGFLWNENRFDYEGEPAFVEKGFMYAGNGNVDLRRDISDTYGKNWRCWLRKPTEAERRETPWAGDGHE